MSIKLSCALVKPALTRYKEGPFSRYLKQNPFRRRRLVIPQEVLAQETPVLVPTDSLYLNSLLFLIGGFLVFWMAAGFARR